MALGGGGSVLAGPPSIAWQQWGMVYTAGVRHESKGGWKRGPTGAATFRLEAIESLEPQGSR